ncbi:MAG: GNAT family N-acetyltransferase [Bacteroidales bacterium]|nr:GNAT family N-acetyltransferase [Bacteroidales bacterium]
MKTVIKKFDQLTPKELYEIIRARENVFIVEQDCPYQDADGLDEGSVHIFYADDDGKVLAYLRVLDREGDPGTVQIGRVITISRGTGLGRKILHEAVEYAINVMGAESLYLEAQTYAAGFYAKEGFRINSEEFFEDGIPHVIMRRPASLEKENDKEDIPPVQFRKMRRFKQEISKEECEDILTKAPRGILAVRGEMGYPYTIPVNQLYHEGKIYIHGAKAGHKHDSILRSPKVSFCVLDEGVKYEGEWWNTFRSVICFGKAAFLQDEKKKDRILRLIGNKYFPEGYDLEDDMKKNGPQADIIEITIEHMSGKKVREK